MPAPVLDKNPAIRSQVTALVHATQSGDRSSLDGLVALVYDELKAIAHRVLAGEPAGRTLQTTALVHEAYLKLVDATTISTRGRAYFFAAAARAMRQVLVDHARRRKAAKRDFGAPLDLDDVQLAVDEFAVEVLDLDGALERLAALNPRHARVIECRHFGGLSVEETASALGVSPRTIKHDWALARAWLYRALRAPAGG
ncbi:MAG: ECF-type sigma factor [Gemmatimonadaceae bacterium]